MNFKDRLTGYMLALDARLPRGWKVALVALILVAILAHWFSQSPSTAIWLVAKLLAGAFVGYIADRMGFPEGRPHLFIGQPELLREAWRRRAIIIAGCVVAAGVSA